jgi:hypothetical protein
MSGWDDERGVNGGVGGRVRWEGVCAGDRACRLMKARPRPVSGAMARVKRKEDLGQSWLIRQVIRA